MTMFITGVGMINHVYADFISDIHLEGYSDPLSEVDILLSHKRYNILLLCGDIIELNLHDETIEVFKRFTQSYDHVLYVLGNHEYYGGESIDKTHDMVKRLHDTYPNLYVLGVDDDKAIFYNQVELCIGDHLLKFIGGTAWFPCKVNNQLYYRPIYDFSRIKGLINRVYDFNSQLKDHLLTNCTSNHILMTHHLPMRRVMHHKYERDPMSRFFIAEFDEVICNNTPRLSLYGHTHIPNDMVLFDTRFICNPYGNYHQRKSIPQNKRPKMIHIPLTHST